MKHSNKEIQERRSKVLKIIERTGKISVQELSGEFDVSVLTLRRDLDYLVSEGCVRRYHGGVQFITSEKEIPQYEEKQQSKRNEKSVIAQYIASIIPPESTVFLNSGTSTYEVMRYLKDKRETIITNSALAYQACEGGNCEIICTGGTYNHVTRSYNGDLATSIIQRVYADFCVFGVNGICAKAGITTSVFQETIVNECMIRRCNGQRIIAADSSKIGKTFRFTNTDLQHVDLLVTVSTADADELKAIQDCGINIVLADQVMPKAALPV